MLVVASLNSYIGMQTQNQAAPNLAIALQTVMTRHSGGRFESYERNGNCLCRIAAGEFAMPPPHGERPPDKLGHCCLAIFPGIPCRMRVDIISDDEDCAEPATETSHRSQHHYSRPPGNAPPCATTGRYAAPPAVAPHRNFFDTETSPPSGPGICCSSSGQKNGDRRPGAGTARACRC